MSLIVLASVGAALLGLTLVLAEFRWFARVPLAERLRPYAMSVGANGTRLGLMSVESFREVIGPLSGALGARLARLFGVSEELSTRLARIHASTSVSDFRVRQVGTSALAGFAAIAMAASVGLPGPAAALFVVGSPVLAFLVVEQRLAIESQRWQRRIFLELPVVSEQLAMLLSAGFSLNGALSRIAERGSGCCSTDLGYVVQRTRQGLTDIEALREWATTADVDALDRLVSVLALNHEAADLGRLIADEARATRRDVQREVMEQIETRTQQVWIPVTVAALVPGVILMAIPFLDALSLFADT